jgi:cation diffusion facilitator family transporter
MSQHKYKKGEMITFYCIVGNLLLSILKALAGFLGGSKAMIADAFHSASDTVATIVVYFSLKISRKPADSAHPYGHGKVEPIASAFVGITLLIAAGLIMRDIFITIIENDIKAPSLIALVAATGSIVIKEIMFRVTIKTGKAINSEAMIANAWDHRSDAYSSVGVFFGILGSILGARFGIIWLKYLDPLAGAVVAVLIIKIAMAIIIKALSSLMDTSISDATIKEITALALQIFGVKGISWVRGRTVGSDIQVDIAIQVDSSLNVKEGHDIASLLKTTLKSNIPHVEDVLVHINPYIQQKQ